jgi:hypothetical protein
LIRRATEPTPAHTGRKGKWRTGSRFRTRRIALARRRLQAEIPRPSLELVGSREVAINPRLEAEINPTINPEADDGGARWVDHGVMTTTDYIVNAVFVLIVACQARERRLDVRSLVVPLVLVAFVAHGYLHSIPSTGNDLVLVAVLGATGLAMGVVSGMATHVRAGGEGFATARVGWLAGGLLIAGISSRMIFAFAVGHGAQGAVRHFSVAHQIGAAAWPVALVSMAVLEVTARVVIVHVRGLRLVGSVPAAGTVAAAA